MAAPLGGTMMAMSQAGPAVSDDSNREEKEKIEKGKETEKGREE